MDYVVFLQFAYDVDTSNIGPKLNDWTIFWSNERENELGSQVLEICKTLKNENDDYGDTREKLDVIILGNISI